MKPSQKLIVDIEGITNVVAFRDIDVRLHRIVNKLEREGDQFGLATGLITNAMSGVALCVMIGYADKKRGPVKPTLFGYDQDELMEKQFN